MAWKEIAKAKQDERQARIERFYKFSDIKTLADIESNLTSEEIAITEAPGYELVEKMKAGNLKVRTVVDAFCKRAALAQALTNCLTEIFFVEAFERADKLDATFGETTAEEKGLLYGLPISIKDSLDVIGYDSTIGYISFCNKPASADAVMYTCLLAQGAIPIAKTNIPQTLMLADSVNNVWGRVTNPYNSKFTAGGSSGGEGAIVACRGSAIGIGTDIAGSIRMPAWVCGTYGLRPSAYRLPFSGQTAPCASGTNLIMPVIGPLANNAKDLELLWRAVLAEKPWLIDPTSYPIPARDVGPTPEKLRVGYFSVFGDRVPHPPVLRAIKEATESLTAAGHEVVEIKDWPQDFESLRSFCTVLLSLDAYKSTYKLLNEGSEPLVQAFVNAGLSKLPNLTADDIVNACAASEKFDAAAHSSFNKNLPGDFDVLICPAAPHTATPHDTYPSLEYTVMWNALDLPAVIVPVTKVDPKVDLPRKLDTKGKSSLAQQTEELWDPEGMAGLPVCIQVVGRKFREEELLASVQKIAEALEK